MKAYQVLELEKDALILLAAITKGEKIDLEIKVSELENKKSIVDKRVEELETHNSLLEEQIKVVNEK